MKLGSLLVLLTSQAALNIVCDSTDERSVCLQEPISMTTVDQNVSEDDQSAEVFFKQVVLQSQVSEFRFCVHSSVSASSSYQFMHFNHLTVKGSPRFHEDKTDIPDGLSHVGMSLGCCGFMLK